MKDVFVDVELPFQVGAHLALHLGDLAQSEHSLNNNTPGLVRVSVVAHNLAGEHERGDKEPVARQALGGRETRLEALQQEEGRVRDALG